MNPTKANLLLIVVLCLGSQAHAAPANDLFANRIAISGVSNRVTGSNLGATKESGEPNHGGNSGGKSVWWSWSAPTNGMVTINTIGSAFDTLLGVYTGTSVSGLTTVKGDDDSGGNGTSEVSFLAVSGTAYRIAVDGWLGGSGNIVLTVQVAPPNDLLANARSLIGLTNNATGNNFGASRESGEPFHAGINSLRSVWWTWTAATNGVVSVDTVGSDFDTVLAVYTGYSVSSLTPVASDNDGGSNQTSQLTFAGVAGVTYQIAVAGYNLLGGRIVLHLWQTPTPPPNDMFTNRVPIPSAGTSALLTYNERATKEPGEPNHANNAGGGSVWWTWTAPFYGNARVDTIGSLFDTVLAIYIGDSVSNLVLVASDDDSGGNRTSLVNFSPIPGTRYQIAVDGYDGAYGTVALSLEQLFGSPPNDAFVKRTVLAGLTNTVPGSNINASKEPAEPNHAGYTGAGSVWWTWTAPTNGVVIADTIGSVFDTILAVYTGSFVTNLVTIGSDFESAGNGGSRVAFLGTAGTTYQIAVDGSYGYLGSSSGNIVLNVRQIPSPANDFFANRITITGVSNAIHAANTTATKEPGEPNHAGSPTRRSLWWTWTAPTDGTVVLETTGSSVRTVLAVYAGDTVSNLTPVASSYGRLVFAAVAEVTYQIAVDDYESGGDIVLILREGMPPLNDAFANRIAINGTTNTVTGNNEFGSNEPGEPLLGTGQSVWWTWTAPTSGVMRLDTLGSSFRAVLAVYSGDSLSNMIPLAASDSYYNGSALTFSCQAESNYQFAVSGYLGENGAIVLNLSPVLPPPNDNFDSRFLIPYGYAVAQGNYLGATLEPGEPSHGGNRRSIWWTWTAPASGLVKVVDTGSSPSAAIDVYTGDALSMLTNVSTMLVEDYQYIWSFTALAGAQYQIAVSSFSNPNDAASAGNTKIGLRLLNWEVATLNRNFNPYPYSVSFDAAFRLGNAGYNSPTLRLRLVAVPGYSATEGYGTPFLPPNQDLGTFPVSVPPGTSTNITTSGVCPAPDPVSDQNFGVGWSVVAVLEEQVGTNWFIADRKHVFTGVWPIVSGFNGPGGGVITINPGLSGGTFNPIALSAMIIKGSPNVTEGTSTSYYATALFSNGQAQNFTNAAWSSSLPLIASINTNGLLTVAKVTSNTLVSISVPYSYGGANLVATTNVTIMNLPPPLLTKPTALTNGSLLLTLNGVPGRMHVIEATTNFAATIPWLPLSTNTIGMNGLTNIVDWSRTNFPRRFYRARELE